MSKKKFFSFLLLIVIILISIYSSSHSGLSGMLLQFAKFQSETKNSLSVASTFSPAKEETTPNSLDVFKLRVKYNEPHYSTCTLQLINQSKEEMTFSSLFPCHGGEGHVTLFIPQENSLLGQNRFMR